MSRRADFGRETRQRIALEAARIMAEEAITDFHTAKRKAAHRLGVSDRIELPSNGEVDAALKEYLQLFKKDKTEDCIRKLRIKAVEAMQFLHLFKPRLVGSVLEGTAANNNAKIVLHVFTDVSEDINFFLMEKQIPFEVGDVRLRMSIQEDYRRYPVVRFIAGDAPVELIIFPANGLRQAPLSPIDGKPCRRVALAELQDLLQGPPQLSSQAS